MTDGDILRAANIEKYGSLEAYKAEMRKRGSKGGKKSKSKLTKAQARERGRLGGIATAKKRNKS